MSTWQKALVTIWLLDVAVGIVCLIGLMLFDNYTCDKLFPYFWGSAFALFALAGLSKAILSVWEVSA